MSSQNGSHISSCTNCTLRGNGFFCQMERGLLKELDLIHSTSTYPQGSVLFMENQQARGIYILCEGQVKLSLNSREGKTLSLRIARPGEVLGLSAAFAGMPHEVTAETLRPCQIAFVRREDFLRFLAQHPEIYRTVLNQVGKQLRVACEQIRTLGLANSVTAKVARLLLDWSSDTPQTKQPLHTTMPLTHEEIAEFVGTTRESVTRALSSFKNRQLISIHGSSLTIPNPAALRACVGA